jgi:hypothetical protein
MSYTITTTSGTTLATVADGTINDTATSLTLIGKNYAGYGVFINDNYVKLLENFSNDVPPLSALPGQLWFDLRNKILKVNDGATWKSISSGVSSTSQPTSPIPGDIWWDTTNTQLKVWSGSAWIVVGPIASTTTGTNGAVIETIQDTVNTSHAIIRFYVSNATVAILSRDATFTPLPAISGFATIRPGFNLASTDVVSNAQFTGNAENAIRLNGLAATSYLRSDQAINLPFTITGTELNSGANLNISATSLVSTIKNLQSNADLDLFVRRSGTDTRAIGISGSTANVALVANLAVNGGVITTTATTASLFNTGATTLNIGQAATSLSIGSTTGTATIRNAVVSLTGNVGIGTITPGQKLSVVGTIESTTGGFKLPDGNTISTLPAGGLVGVTATQTLTNKTLTSPAINGGTITGGTQSSPTITGGTQTSVTANSFNLNNPQVTNYTETLFSATGSTTVNLANGTLQRITTNGPITITLPASSTGKSYVIIVAYGGNHTVTWAGGTNIRWNNGLTPVQTSINGKFDIFTFFCDGTNTYGAQFGRNF